MKQDTTIVNTIDGATKLSLLAELDGLQCELDHSGDPEGKRRAVNYFMLQLLDGTLLSIPVCEYCAFELNRESDFEQYLLYCLKCGETKQLYKNNCKNKEYDQVNFIKSCPKCTAKNKWAMLKKD